MTRSLLDLLIFPLNALLAGIYQFLKVPTPLSHYLTKMYDIIRDSSFGLGVRFLTNNRYFLHPDEKPGFELPSPTLEDDEKTAASDSEGATDLDLDGNGEVRGEDVENPPISSRDGHDGHVLAATVSRPIHPVLTSSGITLIDWYSTGEFAITVV